MNYFNDVKRFHDKFGLETPANFFLIPQDLHEFRVKFFVEELTEYIESYETYDMATAIDSLIDLVYITCGAALLHGFNGDIFVMPRDNSRAFPPQISGIHTKVPVFLTFDDHFSLKTCIRLGIAEYELGYAHADSKRISEALNDIYWSCLHAAEGMSFYKKRWDLLWADVQRANMSKERVLKAEDSKRGSTWDVRKPEGWIPPRSEELVAMMMRGEA